MPKFLSDGHFVGSTTDVHISGVLNISGQDIGGVTSPSLYLGQLTNAYQAGMQSSVHLTMKTTNNAGNFYWYRGNSSVMYYSDALYVDKFVDKGDTSYYLDPGSTTISLDVRGRITRGSKTFGGGNGVYADTRLGIVNNGSLTSIVNASTYNDANFPDYGLVFIQGPSTSSYNVWSISPDGPAKGSDLNFIYQAQATNIHTQTPMLKLHGSTGNATFAGEITSGSQVTVDSNWVTNEGSLSIVHDQNTLGGIGIVANSVYKGGLIQRDGTSGDFMELTTYTSQPLKLRTNNTDALTLDTSQNATIAGNVTIGSDTNEQDFIVYGNDTGEKLMWDGSESRLVINHDTDDFGVGIFTVGSAQMTQPQLKIGRDASQYWGVYTEDRNSYLIHRQDETSGTMTTRFQQWDSNTSDLSGEWLWQSGDGTGASMTTALTLTQGGNATFLGEIKQSTRTTLHDNGTITWGSSNNFGELSWDGDYALYRGRSGKGIKLQTNGSTTALTLDTSQNATFAGTISSGAITSSASVIASGNSNSFGNTTTAALSATSGTFSASVTAAGNSNSFGATTFTGSLTMPNYIYHSGDTNTYFGFGGADYFNVVTGGSNAIIAHDNGAVYLYHSGSQKFQTMSTGVSVSGSQELKGTTSTGATSPKTELGGFITVPGAETSRMTYLTGVSENKLGGLYRKGSGAGYSLVSTKDGSTITSNWLENAFQANDNFSSLSSTTASTNLIIEITVPTMFHGSNAGIAFSNGAWRAKNVKIEVYDGTSWSTIYDVSNSDRSAHINYFSKGGTGVTKLKYTLTNFATTSCRISSIFANNYTGGNGVNAQLYDDNILYGDQTIQDGYSLYVPAYVYHTGDTNTYFGFENNDEYRIVIGGAEGIHINSSRIRINKHIEPSVDSNYDIGTSSLKFRKIYADTLYGDGSNLTNLPSGSSTTINNNADNRVITGSGTADTLEAESGLTFDGNDLTIVGSGTTTKRLYVSSDTDYGRAHIGRASLGKTAFDDHAGFSHIDHSSQTNYALLQNSSGDTFINTKTGQTTFFRVNNSTVGKYNSNGLYFPIYYDSNDTTYYSNPAGNSILNQISFGVPALGSNTKARFLSIEGNADASGEGSGRIFFTEHNSTDASKSKYGMSIGYRGGSTSIVGTDGNTWTGLSDIGNGQWGMWGHNNSAAGSLIMYGDRAATFIDFLGNDIKQAVLTSNVTGGSGLDAVSYTNLTNVPSSFTPAQHTQAFSTITSTPTTLSGYGITDAATSAQGTKADNALPKAGGTMTGDLNIGGIRIVSDNDGTDQGTAWIRSNSNYLVLNAVDGDHVYLNWDTGNGGGSGHVFVEDTIYAQKFYDRVDSNYYLHPGDTGASLNIAGRIEMADTKPIMWDNAQIRAEGNDLILDASTNTKISREVMDTDGQAIKGYTQNKATSSSWTNGNTSNQTGFYGGNFNGSEITTKWVNGPHGERTLAAETDGDTGNDYDGGYVKAINNLDINKAHLSIVYVKRISSAASGNVYHGTGAGTNQITNLSNTSNGNPYFQYHGASIFPQDVWCVSIGVIQANNDSNTDGSLYTGSSALQGVYRCDTGQKIANGHNAWKMGSAGSSLSNGIRFFHYYSTDANCKLQWAKPGFYEINGDEPSLSQILSAGASRGLHLNGGDIYSSKFYDSDNTSYYVDPASTSTSFVTQGDWRVPSGIAWSGEYTGGGKIQQHSNHWYLQSPDAGGVIFRNASGSNKFIFDFTPGDGTATGSWKAPIFYDSNDTTYYIDPGSTGTSGKFRQFVNIGDSSSYSTNSGSWGARLNVTDNVHARIDVAQDADSMQASWYAHTGHSGSYIGTVTDHHFYMMANNSVVMTLNSTGYAQAAGSMRAPIFYDSNDTAYYVNPSGGSVLNGDVHIKDPSTAGTSGRVRFGTNTSWNNQIGLESYWMLLGCNQNEGFKFRDSSSNMLLQLNGGNSSSGNGTLSATFAGELYIPSYIRHVGDSNTYFGFNGADSWKLHLGGGDRFVVNTSEFTSNLNVHAPIYYDKDNTNFYANPGGTSKLSSIETLGIKINTITSNNMMGYHTSANFSNLYGYLGVDVNGKVGVIEKEITFSIEGTGWVGRHSNPVKLLDAPGADKMIVVQEINILINYTAPIGIGSNGICRTTDNTAYAVGFYQGSGTNGNFTVTGVMPRATMQFTTTTNDRIVNRDVPVEGTKLYPNKALYWKTTRDASSTFGQYPGAQHIVKVRYRILDVSTEFTGAYASAQNINSSSITNISQAF